VHGLVFLPEGALVPNRAIGLGTTKSSAILTTALDLRASGAEGNRFGVKPPEFTSGGEGALRKPPDKERLGRNQRLCWIED